MLKLLKWRSDILTTLEVPEELFYHNTIVNIIGKSHAIIENYRSILSYSKEEIILQTHQGKMRISGNSLKIPYYTLEEMHITGVIKEIEYE